MTPRHLAVLSALSALRHLVQQVVAKGIRAVSGQVIVDVSLFREGARELGTRVTMSPLVINDNVIDVVVAPAARAGDAATVTVSPRTSYLTVQANLVTADSGTPAAVCTVEDSTNTPAVEPASLAASYVDSLVVAEHVSLPLTQAARVILKTSQNLHASNMPLFLGSLPIARDSGKTGFDLARGWFEREGLDLNGAVQGDGAGGDAYFSPAFMTRFLAVVAARPWAGAFRAALPVLGTDGTLAQVQVNSPGAGKVFAKTGTFSSYDPLNRRSIVHGKGLAGYFTSKSGREIAFAIYVNNVAIAGADAAMVAGQALGEIASIAWETVK